jgi:hypothetical protein
MPSLSFTQANMAKVLDGSKAQTRRTWATQRVQVGDVCRLKIGRTGWMDQYVVITGVRREALGNMTEQDARAEGCRNRYAYVALWDSIYGKQAPWRKGREVWVIDFRLGTPVPQRRICFPPAVTEIAGEGAL